MTRTKLQTSNLEMKEAPLPAAELARFRLWLLENTNTDTDAAKKVNVTRTILYRARRGQVLSARNLHRILEFIKTLPAVAA